MFEGRRSMHSWYSSSYSRRSFRPLNLVPKQSSTPSMSTVTSLYTLLSDPRVYDPTNTMSSSSSGWSASRLKPQRHTNTAFRRKRLTSCHDYLTWKTRLNRRSIWIGRSVWHGRSVTIPLSAMRRIRRLALPLC